MSHSGIYHADLAKRVKKKVSPAFLGGEFGSILGKAASRINKGVQGDMEDKIMDFLTLKVLHDPHFQANPHARVRYAYIKARKIYKKLTEEQKQAILKHIEE